MQKSQIITEIQRTAAANGGIPLGHRRFETETGIKYHDWYGVHSARWSDAIREAGLEANKFQAAHATDELLEKLATFALEMGRLPVAGDLRLKRKNDRGFPSADTFRRLGSKAHLVRSLAEYCRPKPRFAQVLEWCDEYQPKASSQVDDNSDDIDEKSGYVYLFKSGRYFKIGMSNSVGRREYEMSIQMPERVETVHSIRTDDPHGIEEYWHRRFADRRKNGEWFDLSAADVRAFKRRKFM